MKGRDKERELQEFFDAMLLKFWGKSKPSKLIKRSKS